MPRVNKKFEEFIRGTVEEAIEWTKQNEVRGEFCILAAGSTEEPAPEEQWWETISVYDHIEHYINEKGMNSKEAIKQLLKIEICRNAMYIKSIMSIKISFS